MCQCVCGNAVEVSAYALQYNQRKSCGCKSPNSLVGQKFNLLTVIRIVSHVRNDRGHVWLCRCDCGKEISARGYLLKSGRKTSCGCRAPTASWHSPKLLDLAGQQIGKLTVVKRLFIKGKNATWLCRCECGKEVAVSRCSLRAGTTKSCGCLQRRLGNNSPHWKGYQQIPGRLWSSILNGARSRDIKVEVTIEDVWNIFNAQQGRCALSGIELKFAPRSNRTTDQQTASLDRIDSLKGYIPGNVQWIHKILQHMKSDHTQQQFVEWCTAIAIHQNQGLFNKTTLQTL